MISKNRKRRLLRKKVKTIAKKHDLTYREAFDLHISRRPENLKKD